ncbi:MAG: hypothetical protein QXD04_02795 [Candidatus Bathyarchaeia archaeon]
MAMIGRLRRNSSFVFRRGLLDHFAHSFRQQRKAVAWKLNNPRINQITFKTLRHFNATMEYRRTRDILHVKHVLGYKRIEYTLLYTHLVDMGSDEYTSKVARNAEEACKLVEAGFEFVCNTPENLMVFRKRK